MVSLTSIVTLLLLTTLSGSIGALSLKYGMNQLIELKISFVLKNRWLIIGVLLYIFSSVTNILLFNYLDYSIAFPMTSLTYVWTVIISYFIFKEKLTPLKCLAICAIIVGVIIISR